MHLMKLLKMSPPLVEGTKGRRTFDPTSPSPRPSPIEGDESALIHVHPWPNVLARKYFEQTKKGIRISADPF